MDREQYVNLRRRGELSKIFFLYHKEKNTPSQLTLKESEFNLLFDMFKRSTNGAVVISNFLRRQDNHFNLVFLLDTRTSRVINIY